MDNARNVAQDRQQDVNEEVGIASSLKEDTKRRKKDGEDDLDDVAASSQIDEPLRVRRYGLHGHKRSALRGEGDVLTFQ